MRRSSIFNQAPDAAGRILWSYVFNVPTRIQYGIGISETLGEEAKKLGAKRALLVTDQGLVKAGLADQMVSYLKDAGIAVDVYDQVVPNPVDSTITNGYKMLQETRPDVIVGLGGGSAIDSAKLIAMMETNPGRLSDYFGYGHVKNKKKCPLIVVPTTSGTGTEVTMWAVVTDTAKRQKQGVGSELVMADIALVDPLVTVTMPPKATAEVGLDALSHALEAYVSTTAWPLTDAIAEAAIQLVADNLRTAVFNGMDIKARDAMMMASMLGGLSFPSAGVGMVHGMGHGLSAFYNFSHGYTMGAMMPFVEEFNYMANPSKFARLAQLLGENVDGLSDVKAAACVPEALGTLFKDVKMPNLVDAGAKTGDIPALVDLAVLEIANNATNSRPMTKDDISRVYEEAFANSGK
jgi:alcohol dehydrogenase class IV